MGPETPTPPLGVAGTWGEYQNLVLDRLGRLDHEVGGLRNDVTSLRETVVGLRIKAGVWGALAGSLPVLVAILLAVLAKLLP